MDDIAELQVIFHSDKTARPGEGRARSFHAILDRTDSKCIVRDTARLWLISERIPDYTTNRLAPPSPRHLAVSCLGLPRGLGGLGA